jgi:hypothetical protein
MNKRATEINFHLRKGYKKLVCKYAIYNIVPTQATALFAFALELALLSVEFEWGPFCIMGTHLLGSGNSPPYTIR